MLNYIKKAADSDSVIVGFNVFGYEDACEIVRAAEHLNTPVMLMTNRDASKALSLPHWGAMLSSIAKNAKVPVGVHLDHCSDIPLIMSAIDNGYTSVMYDGSKLSIEENTKNTKQIVEYAHSKGVFVEAEVGNVPYSDLGQTEIYYTDPREASYLVENSDVDILAVSVGNIHRLTQKTATIDFDLLKEIENCVSVPLVIHGSSGICDEDFEKIKKYNVGKINLGTSLRVVFGNELRVQIMNNPNEFDRLKLFESPREKLYEKAYDIIKNI